MSSKTTAPEATISERVRRLHQKVLHTPPALCAERAVLVTDYFRRRANRKKPVVQQKAEALAHILRHKRATIYPDELLVGSFCSHRVGGGLLPELHGVAMLEDLFVFPHRQVNPIAVSKDTRYKLLFKVLPYWLPRFLALKIRPRHRAVRFVVDQLNATRYLINETGGISHFVPDYGRLLALGTTGYRAEANQRLQQVAPDSAEAQFLQAVVIVCDGLDDFAANYATEARNQAKAEANRARQEELELVAQICDRVPSQPARSLHEALQCLVFAQIALNLESLDNSVSPGRLDQILWPYYEGDRLAKKLTQPQALELLGCYAVKLCEIVPIFSRRVSRFHGGMFNGQVVVVGGRDEKGDDATNEITYLLLLLMDQLRTRQPNYHARLHKGSPDGYRCQIAKTLAAGAVSPALYNDEVITPILQSRGVSDKDALNYALVGCVEPVAAGKSYFSTDAALTNLPLCLELALNGGRRFNHWRRLGIATPPAEECTSIEEVLDLFSQQVDYLVEQLLADLWSVERANAEYHPTPLTSMLLDGCMEKACDASAGGARYNGSGVQAVGIVDIGDSLTALECVVFRDGKATMAEVIEACKRDFQGNEVLLARLRHAPKFGNDDAMADGFVARVMELFANCIAGRENSRGGAIAPGFYSVTSHQGFGEKVGAMPSGRRSQTPFSSGISPANGVRRSGPTAALRSMASLPLHRAQNGINFNLELAPWAVSGAEGSKTMQRLLDGAFRAGCMQLQVNVLDPKVLIDARNNPGKHPGLLVRVSGYSAYFDDLSPSMKQEIIDRTVYELASAESSADTNLHHLPSTNS